MFDLVGYAGLRGEVGAYVPPTEFREGGQACRTEPGMARQHELAAGFSLMRDEAGLPCRLYLCVSNSGSHHQPTNRLMRARYPSSMDGGIPLIHQVCPPWPPLGSLAGIPTDGLWQYVIR